MGVVWMLLSSGNNARMRGAKALPTVLLVKWTHALNNGLAWPIRVIKGVADTALAAAAAIASANPRH